MSNANDMTKGSPLPLLVHFAMPLMISSILQQLYSLCDSVIVGRLLGVTAFAALGATAFLSWLPLSMILGLCQGFGVKLSQLYGAGDREGLNHATGISILLSLGAGVLLCGLGLVFLQPLLTALNTPLELMPEAAAYLKITLIGLIPAALYNVCAALLRGMGDSKTPLYALIISTVFNIVLDYVLVAFVHMGVTGVALATVIAQILSLLFCLSKMNRVQALPRGQDYQMDAHTLKALLHLGLPPLFRNGVISVGGLFIQAAVNGFGTLVVAGVTAARRYFSMLEMAGAALEGALATFVGQNAGAGETERIKSGTKTAVRLALAAAVITGAIAFAFAKPLITLFVTAGEVEVILIGAKALRITACFLPALYLLCLYRAALQSMGNTLIPMFSGFLELIIRILCVMLLPQLLKVYSVYLADALGWVGAAILLICAYRRTTRALGQ